jgi:hypothetical protein
MDIKSIQKKIEQVGYYTFLPEPFTELVVGKLKGEDPAIGGILIHSFCSVSIVDIKILIEHGQANLPEESEFASESEAISFIKDKFPL